MGYDRDIGLVKLEEDKGMHVLLTYRCQGPEDKVPY